MGKWDSITIISIVVCIWAAMSYETYIKSNIATEAIKAGLVQDRDGRWVKPVVAPPALPTTSGDK